MTCNGTRIMILWPFWQLHMLSQFGVWVRESSKILNWHHKKMLPPISHGLKHTQFFLLVLKKVVWLSLIVRVKERFHASPSTVRRSQMVTGVLKDTSSPAHLIRCWQFPTIREILLTTVSLSNLNQETSSGLQHALMPKSFCAASSERTNFAISTQRPKLISLLNLRNHMVRFQPLNGWQDPSFSSLLTLEFVQLYPWQLTKWELSWKISDLILVQSKLSTSIMRCRKLLLLLKVQLNSSTLTTGLKNPAIESISPRALAPSLNWTGQLTAASWLLPPVVATS